MRTRVGAAGLLLGAMVAPVYAQEPPANDRVAQALPTRYTAPDCGLKSRDSKVSRAADYLKTGIESENPGDRARAFASGRRVILEAIEKSGQEENPAAWYYLGRLDLQQGDIVGADSTFTKAEALAPRCKQEISRVRYDGWVPLVNAGIEFSKAQNRDSALALFRQANTIYREKPLAYLNAGVLFSRAGQTDSAIVYWQQAARIGEQGNSPAERNAAARNLGAALQRANRHQEAVPILEKYLTWVPDDAGAKRALANSYRATGDTEKAQALEKEVGTAPGGAGSDAALDAAIALYNQKNYREAAAGFEHILAAEPYNRDALYGLANSYIGLKNGPKLAATAVRLLGIEPLNQEIVRMLSTGHRMAQNEVQANKAAIQALGMPVTVDITQFAATGQVPTLTGKATGREAMTAQGEALAATPLTLVFEFIDNRGTVLAHQEVAIPGLKPGESVPIEAKAQAAGVTAWRYKKK